MKSTEYNGGGVGVWGVVSLLLLLVQTGVEMVHRRRAPGCVYPLLRASGTERVPEKDS